MNRHLLLTVERVVGKKVNRTPAHLRFGTNQASQSPSTLVTGGLLCKKESCLVKWPYHNKSLASFKDKDGDGVMALRSAHASQEMNLVHQKFLQEFLQIELLFA